MEVSWVQGWLTAAALNLATSAYLYWVVRPLPLGLRRFWAALPVFPIYVLTPWIFSSTQISGIAVLYCTVTWLASFRVLTFCWGKGPAAEPAIDQNLWRFNAAVTLPIHVQTGRRTAVPRKVTDSKYLDSGADRNGGKMAEGGVQWPALLRQCILKCIGIYICTQLYDYRSSMGDDLLVLVYALQLYFFASIIGDALALAVQIVLGLHTEPHFRQPYLSTSLEDFWAHRWNQTVSTNLRETIYEPLLSWMPAAYAIPEEDASQKNFPSDTGRDSKPGAASDVGTAVAKTSAAALLANGVEHPDAGGERVSSCSQHFDGSRGWQHSQEKKPLWARAVAIIATFFVSGVMHELALFYLTFRITGRMTLFFVVHGIAMVAERYLKRRLAIKSVLPSFGGLLLTLLFTFATARWLFFQPIMYLGIDLEAIREVRTGFKI